MVRSVLVILVVVFGAIALRATLSMTGAGETTALIPRFDGQCIERAELGHTVDIAVGWQAETILRIGEHGVDRVDLAGTSNPGEFKTVTILSDRNESRDQKAIGHSAAIDAIARGEQRVAFTAERINGAVSVKRLRLSGVGQVDDVTDMASIENVAADTLLSIAAIDDQTAILALAESPARGLFDAMLGRMSVRNGKLLSVTADGQIAEIATNLQTPTDLIYRDETGQLYVAEVGFRGFSVWRRGAAGGFERLDRVRVNNAPGRIAMDADDVLWATMHPKTLSWLSGAQSGPTQVALFDFDAKVGDQIYLSVDGPISAGVAAYVNTRTQRMLIFGPHESGLDCRLPDVWRHSEAHPAQRPIVTDD